MQWMYRRSSPMTLMMTVPEVGCVRLHETVEASIPSRLRSSITKFPKTSSPTSPRTFVGLPNLRRHAATLVAHPPAPKRKPSVRPNCPAAGRATIGLAKMSATRFPAQTTSILHGCQSGLPVAIERKGYATEIGSFVSVIGVVRQGNRALPMGE